MKSVLSVLALALCLSPVAHGDDLAILRGNHLDPVAAESMTPGSAALIALKVEASVKTKCDRRNGCAVYVDDAHGGEFRIVGNAGLGSNSGYGGFGGYGGLGNGGIAIIGANQGYDRNSQPNYSLTISYTNSKVVCRHFVMESVFRMMNMYFEKMATPEYVDMVMKKAEAGEDVMVPEVVKYQFLTLATIKPGQAQCNSIDGRNR